MLKLAIITVQSDYLLKVVHQLERIFDSQVRFHPIQLSTLTEHRIAADETVLSAIPRIRRLVNKIYPDVTKFIKSRRSVNPISLGDLSLLEPHKRILVVSDILQATQKIVEELEAFQFGHSYTAYSPESNKEYKFDYIVTPGDLPLINDLDIVPNDYLNIINLGLRVISVETVFDINQNLLTPLDPVTLCKKYLNSLVSVNRRWPVARRNKYLSTWIDNTKDVSANFNFSNFKANSAAMKDLILQAQKLAMFDEHIHISGEAGTGKENLAQAIHNASPRANKPYLKINCSNRKQDELEKELFGWVESSKIYPGLFELADGGTLCIEEIRALTPEMQNRIIQFLDEARILRVYGRKYLPIDVRLITTSLIDIRVLHEQYLIQKELYFKLATFSCHMPSLAERLDDFDDLIAHYLQNVAKRPNLTMHPDTLHILKNQNWEGNLRELNNVLAHLACLAEDHITPDLLPYYIKRTSRIKPPKAQELDQSLDQLVDRIESTGFLDEARTILEIYFKGKRHNQSFGRAVMCEKLSEQGINLSIQQLRLRQQRLSGMGLLHVRLGRAGTTISPKGERLLDYLNEMAP
jgi:DNA-binding NtrC family response regulator